MRTVGNTFVRSEDQVAVIQAVVRALGGDPARSFPETQQLRQQLGPYRPAAGGGPSGALQQAFFRIVTHNFSDMLPAVFITPSVGGWVGVFDRSLEGTDDPQPDLARALSRELQTTTVSFWLLHGDLFRYFLAENGKLRDDYMYFASAQDREEMAFLTGHSLVGNPNLAARLCGRPAAGAALEQILNDEAMNPQDVQEGVASLLEIPFWHLSHRELCDQPSQELPGCLSQFAVVTQGQLHYDRSLIRP